MNSSHDMMDPEMIEATKASLEAELAKWTSEREDVLWDKMAQNANGSFAQRVRLSFDPQTDVVSIIRAWSVGGNASASVDLQSPRESVFGNSLDVDDFPHAPNGHSAPAYELMKHLHDEHVVWLWSEVEADHVSYFIGRSAQVGREEELIAAEVSCCGPNLYNIDLMRLPLSELAHKREAAAAPAYL